MSKLHDERELELTSAPELSYGPRIGKPSNAMPRTGEGEEEKGRESALSMQDGIEW